MAINDHQKIYIYSWAPNIHYGISFISSTSTLQEKTPTWTLQNIQNSWEDDHYDRAWSSQRYWCCWLGKVCCRWWFAIWSVGFFWIFGGFGQIGFQFWTGFDKMAEELVRVHSATVQHHPSLAGVCPNKDLFSGLVDGQFLETSSYIYTISISERCFPNLPLNIDDNPQMS